ncbi:MAG: glycine cleavage system aminomethyltransferase GcvT [Candidatus Lokiarchaeota archaeon]
MIKKTPLYETHVDLGAKMVEFGEWLMPVRYESIKKEHNAVRNNAGIFDVSHMGEFILEGSDVKDLLQFLMINDLNLLEPSKGQYSCMCYENGTVVDDMVYYELTPEKFRMIVNANNIEKDYQWIIRHIGERDVKVTNVSKERSRLAFQGPNTDKYLNSIVDIDVKEIQRFYFKNCNLKGMPIFMARTGYTGERGVEISFESKYCEKVWNALLDSGEGVQPAGLGARDTLRLEACYSLYGHEISDKITPIEAGLNWLAKPKEGIDYMGKEVLMKQKDEGTERIIVGLNLNDRGIIRQGYKLYKDDIEIGYVTSGTYSPTLEKTIGLALINNKFSKVGTTLKIQIRDKLLTAEVVSIPFYRSI